MKDKTFIKKIFYSLIITFLLLLLTFFLAQTELSFARDLFIVLAVLGLLFLILGILLTFISKKEKGKLKIFLRLTGISAFLPLIGTILHNLFYALSTITFGYFEKIFEVFHVSFFLISIIISPILFIIGVVGTIIIFNREKA